MTDLQPNMCVQLHMSRLFVGDWSANGPTPNGGNEGHGQEEPNDGGNEKFPPVINSIRPVGTHGQ